MSELIDELKSYAYSGQDILNMVDQKSKIIIYSDLKHYKNIDEVLEPYNNAVILYETRPNFGHWVCLTKRGNKIEYFDSYANPPDKPLDYVDEKMKKKLGVQYPYLSKLLSDSKYNIVYNTYQLQKLNKKISNCGRYVGLRVAMQEYPLDQYIKMLKNGKLSPDDAITYLTAFN